MKQFTKTQYQQLKNTQEWINILDDPEYDYNQINQAISNYQPGQPTFWKVAEITGEWQFDLAKLGGAKVQATDMYSAGTFNSERASIDQAKFQFGYHRHDLDPVSCRIVQSLDLENVTADVNLQPPGSVKCIHYDTLCSLYSDRSRDYSEIEFDVDLRIPKGIPPMHRMLVALTDWQPGWMFQLGVDQWANWKKGDVIAIDWRNVSHSTANASFVNRPLLKITASAKNNWIDQCISTGTVKKIQL